MFTIATGVQDSGNTANQLIIIAILIIINAFFAASELAILSANPNKLKLKAEKKNKKAKLVLKLQEDEVIALVNEAVDDGVMLESEQKLIENVISFGDLLVKDVMKPRIDVFMININDTPSEIKKKLRFEKYTRVPVYEGNADNIIGIINIKDLFFELKANFTIDEFKSILREPYFVVEGMKARTLFNNLKRIQEHSAIIIDEVGSVSGYVTLEDLIEEITGDIFDEHDEIEKNIVKLDDCNYIVDATISIQDINKELNINLKRDFDFNSLAGHIQNKLEKIPTVDDEYY